MIPIPKDKLPGAHPRLQGRWGYIEGLGRPDWHPCHSQDWWIEEYDAGFEHEKFLDEQRKAIYLQED